MMKATMLALLGVLFLTVPACRAQTIEQCRSASKDLASIRTDSDYAARKRMGRIALGEPSRFDSCIL